MGRPAATVGTEKGREVGRPAGALPGRLGRRRVPRPRLARPSGKKHDGTGEERKPRKGVSKNPTMTVASRRSAGGHERPGRPTSLGRVTLPNVAGDSGRGWWGVPGGAAGARLRRKSRVATGWKIFGLQPQEGRSHDPRIDLGRGPDRRAGETVTATRCGDELMHSSSRPKREIRYPRKKEN